MAVDNLQSAAQDSNANNVIILIFVNDAFTQGRYTNICSIEYRILEVPLSLRVDPGVSGGEEKSELDWDLIVP